MRELDELLRDGAGALYIGARLEIVQRGAGNADQIKSGMRIKPRVLGGKERVLDVIGQRVESHRNAVFVQIQPRHDRAATIRDQQRFVGRIDFFKVEHMPCVLRKQPYRAANQRREKQQHDGAQKTPTAASAIQAFIGSEDFLLAHSNSMPRERRAYARGSRKRRMPF